MGVLLNSGHDFDALIDQYSFDQIGLLATAVMTHKVDLMNMVAEPLMAALGVGYKPASTTGKSTRGKPNPNSHKNSDYESAKAKEDAMNRALSRFPVRVRNVKSAKDTAPSDG